MNEVATTYLGWLGR